MAQSWPYAWCVRWGSYIWDSILIAGGRPPKLGPGYLDSSHRGPNIQCFLPCLHCVTARAPAQYRIRAGRGHGDMRCFRVPASAVNTDACLCGSLSAVSEHGARNKQPPAIPIWVFSPPSYVSGHAIALLFIISLDCVHQISSLSRVQLTGVYLLY